MSEHLAGQRSILRRRQVEERLGVSCSFLYDRLNPKSRRHDPEMPRPLRIGNTGRTVGWDSEAVDAYISLLSARAGYGGVATSAALSSDATAGHGEVNEAASIFDEQKRVSTVPTFSSATSKATHLPVGWVIPTAWLFDGAQERATIGLSSVDLQKESLIFADFWRSVSGPEGAKANWRSTWLNWCRTLDKWRPKSMAAAEDKSRSEIRA